MSQSQFVCVSRVCEGGDLAVGRLDGRTGSCVSQGRRRVEASKGQSDMVGAVCSSLVGSGVERSESWGDEMPQVAEVEERGR